MTRKRGEDNYDQRVTIVIILTRISEYIHINLFTQMNIRIENFMNIQIYSNIRLVLHSNTLTHECPNLFVQTNLTQINVRIYTNKCPNEYLCDQYF